MIGAGRNPPDVCPKWVSPCISGILFFGKFLSNHGAYLIPGKIRYHIAAETIKSVRTRTIRYAGMGQKSIIFLIMADLGEVPYNLLLVRFKFALRLWPERDPNINASFTRFP
jgi:hypothetical protein